MLFQSCEKEADTPELIVKEDSPQIETRGLDNSRPPTGSTTIVEVPDDCGDVEIPADCTAECIAIYEKCIRKAQWRFIMTHLKDTGCEAWIADIQQYYQNPQYHVAVPVGGEDEVVQGGYHNFDDIQIYINDDECFLGNIAQGNFNTDCENCNEF